MTEHDQAQEQDAPVPARADRDPTEGLRAVERPSDAEDGLPDGPQESADEETDWAALAEADPRSPGELLAELTEAEARRDEYLDDVRRARAEFENYRKRMLREASQMRAAGTAELAGRLLEVLDDFDRTLDAARTSPDEGLRKGVELVHGKLADVLQASGLQRIEETGVPFDPERHEAVQQVPAAEPVDVPVVDQVLRPGYEMGGRVIRAAMVAVRQ